MAGNKEFVLSTIIQVLDKATTPLKKIGQGFGAVGMSMERTANTLNQLSERTKKIGDSFSNAGRSLTTGITLPIIGLGAAALKTFGDFEMLTANFVTMFQGNEKAARDFLAQIENYANVTPYTTKSLAKNAQTMMSFGMSSEKTMETLKRLGDIAGGNAERMDSLSLAFAQVSSAGRLQGQDLLQMINAGFNPLQIISKKTGKSMADLKKIMEKGGISAEAVAEAFKIATEKGGTFYKGAERGSKTLYGLFSTLKDEGEKSLRMLGETLKDALNLSEELPRITKRISEITRSLAEWIKQHPELTKFIIKFTLLLATLGPALMMVGKITTTFSTLFRVVSVGARTFSVLFKAMSVLKAVNLSGVITGAAPFLSTLGAIAAAVGVVTSAAYGLGKALDVIEEKFGKYSIGLRQSLYSAPVVGSMMQALDMARGKHPAQQAANVKNGNNKTEITVKVEAEPGTSASVDKIKSKGNSMPKITSGGYLGNIYMYGQQ